MCPCVKCQNARCFDKVILTKHLVQNGFTTDYETWMFHGEKYTAVAAKESMNDRVGVDRIDEMLKLYDQLYDQSFTWILRIHLCRRSKSSLGS
jgi:hypothetical protein